MDKKDKEIIKKLAKKSLKEKWYPIIKGEKEALRINDYCAFCDYIDEKDGICKDCYINRLIPDFCLEIDEHYSPKEIVNILEQLAKFGELKDDN